MSGFFTLKVPPPTPILARSNRAVQDNFCYQALAQVCAFASRVSESMSAIGSRVENRRSGFSLPVACGLGFRLAAAIRFGLALFPVPAHRTGEAELPHPALGKDSRC